jgi:arylsulfatase A-like enzyme
MGAAQSGPSRRQFLGVAAGALVASRPPNLIVIFADDLGYGDLSCYGGELPTPNLDRLAREGVRFTQGYVASPVCSPSRVAITTGQFPARHLIFSYLNTRATHRQYGMRDFLDPDAATLPRALMRAGYATGHFGKWHMGGGRDVGDAPLPQRYGFDESYTSFEGLGDRALPPGRLSEQSAALGRGKITRAPKHELTRIFVDRALDFAKRNRERPFYINLWPDDVHDPFEPKPELMRKYERYSANKYLQQFYAVLDEFDRQMGRFVDGIDQLGLGRDTLIVFIGDNGPTAWPRYYKEGVEPPGSTAGLRGRKWSLYEGGVREPFLARWTGHIPAGRVDRSSVVASTDLFPTFCRLSGAVAPADLDGEDISQALLGRPIARRKDLYWEYGRDATYLRPGLERDRSPNLAMRSGRWKLLLNADGSGAELYDLEKDPEERRNLAKEQAAVTRRLSTKLLAWRRSLPAPKTTS